MSTHEQIVYVTGGGCTVEALHKQRLRIETVRWDGTTDNVILHLEIGAAVHLKAALPYDMIFCPP